MVGYKNKNFYLRNHFRQILIYASRKAAFSLEQATKAQKGRRGIALLFPNLGNRWGGWSTPHTDRFTPRNDPVPTVQEAGWASGSIWVGEDNFFHAGIPSPDRPARSESPC